MLLIFHQVSTARRMLVVIVFFRTCPCFSEEEGVSQAHHPHPAQFIVFPFTATLSRKSELLSKFLEEVLQLTKMPSKRMAGNLIQAWQTLANKPNAKDMPAFVVMVPQLVAAFASHIVTVGWLAVSDVLYLNHDHSIVVPIFCPRSSNVKARIK